MENAEQFLKFKLNERKANHRLRELTYSKSPVDFCSNDYLGLAQSDELNQLIKTELNKFSSINNGATGSRLLSGNHPFTEETEQHIAEFHSSNAALLFNSGYDANVGILSSIPQRGDTIICDELIHASLIDGARLSYAERFRFKHNDIDDLTQKLKNAKGISYVVVESIYSMDGDMAPLLEISELCNQYQANLIVDEAHAIGIFGDKGKGLVHQLGLADKVFARIITFGKALGTHGAAILGSHNLRAYLVNFARSFIYTTALPPHQIIAISCAYKLLGKHHYAADLTDKIKAFNNQIAGLSLTRIPSNSCIQTVLFNNDQTAKRAAAFLQEKGFDVRAILSPTVPEGKERLRICLHLYNTPEEISDLIYHLKELA
ncbi:aminotransferase class I/II-fold pyridoxal phosphate-dependent enzyme [Pedobacter insulae]|uniref:8-amino-7-oxononanoate synthase n=1 Tax=Pedobacter insulae TaxID=414048 RepID=A0A1I2YKE2_9SPHI|nr:8-amino-7-oxononanoate synthase [Pedobacter insulae]SFH25829.1 8-amino-7-oxononanoate synthase [Pedobacter insulae]